MNENERDKPHVLHLSSNWWKWHEQETTFKGIEQRTENKKKIENRK